MTSKTVTHGYVTHPIDHPCVWCDRVKEEPIVVWGEPLRKTEEKKWNRRKEFEKRFTIEAMDEEGTWDAVSTDANDLIVFIAKVESQAIETADSYWKGRYDVLSESMKAIESQSLQKAKERVEKKINHGGYCQLCGFAIHICDEKPCRGRKILSDALTAIGEEEC